MKKPNVLSNTAVILRNVLTGKKYQTIAKHLCFSDTGFQNFRVVECVDNKNKLPTITVLYG